MFRSGVHMWRSTLYLNMTVALATTTGAGAGFGLGLRKCHPAKIAMRTAAPAAIGIKGNLPPGAAEVPAACGSRTNAGSGCCGGTTIVPELVDSGAAITPDCCETVGEAITPDCCETTGAAITADCCVTAGAAPPCG